jgi:DNA excision repair protein ERCC-2
MSEKLSDVYTGLFPYDEARDSQVDGIETIDEAIKNDGIVSMEGACGTGKTLTALVPSIKNTRKEHTDIEQVLCVTSVKQQMEAFQDEIKRINQSLPSGVRPVSAVTLSSVSDLHPFIQKGIIEEGDFDSIDALREGARKLADEEVHNYDYTELYQRSIVPENDELPYGEDIPEADGIQYDPYYAKYRSEFNSDEDNVDEVLPFDPSSSGVMTVEDLIDVCGSKGFCPHSMMRLSLEHVDVVIGNYMHAFDPKTVERISGSIIGEETIAVFDEAHNLVPKVREFLSDSSPVTSIRKSREEVEELSLLLSLSELSEEEVRRINLNSVKKEESSSFSSTGKKDLVEELQSVISSSATITSGGDSIKEFSKVAEKISSEVGVSRDQVEDYIEFLEEFESIVCDQIENKLPLEDEDSINLRDPEEPGLDKISEWIRLNRYDSIVKQGVEIGSVCGIVRNEITEASEKPKTSSAKVGSLVTEWYKKDNTRYYRSIEVKERKKASSYGVNDWQRNLKAEMTIHNCIPKNEISKKLETFKSSILMSATLEPLDVYHQTTGISDLKEDGKDVYECRYGLAFPEKNRVTMGVPANKFKYNNRGSAFNSRGARTDNETREQYRDVVFDVVQETNGSVMIVMPSYNEAEWIGALLEQSYICDSDDIFIDESSSNRETQELKNKFFEAEEGVLVTGARGTLIEGIDYIGDRLSATVVCGVPITNTQSEYKKAIKAAYDAVFDNTDGFTLAFTIPAVWKARQAIGRVIRTDKDIGARILVDERYADDKGWDSVHKFLSPNEREEMEYIPVQDVDLRLGAFWDFHSS